MTNEEAIEFNKNLKMYMKISDKQEQYKFLEENYIALDMAIEALREITWRRRLDISNPPKISIVHGIDKKGEPLDFDVWTCPHCGSELEAVLSCGKVGSFLVERCRWCGQKIDWFRAREVTEA